MSKVDDKNKISKEKHEGDDWEGHSDGEDEQEVANKIKQEKTNKKPQGLKDLFTGETGNNTVKKPATTTNKQQNYKQGGYQKNYNKDYKGGEKKEGAPQFTNKNKKYGDKPYEKDQGKVQEQNYQSKKQELEKPQFSGKVQATNQGTGLADKKQPILAVVEEKKVEEIQIEKPNFVIPTEGHFVDIDKNTDLYLKNLETKKPENEVKYYEGKDNEGKPKYQKDYQKDNTRPYKKNYNNNNYNKPVKAKDEKEYDSDGFEIVNSQQKKPKENNQHREHREHREYKGDKGDRPYKSNYNNNNKKKNFVKGEKKYNPDKENKEGQEVPQESSEGTKLAEIGIKGEIKKQEKETVVASTTITTETKAKGLKGLFA